MIKLAACWTRGFRILSRLRVERFPDQTVLAAAESHKQCITIAVVRPQTPILRQIHSHIVFTGLEMSNFVDQSLITSHDQLERNLLLGFPDQPAVIQIDFSLSRIKTHFKQEWLASKQDVFGCSWRFLI